MKSADLEQRVTRSRASMGGKNVAMSMTDSYVFFTL
jgi:hypothetical protein